MLTLSSSSSTSSAERITLYPHIKDNSVKASKLASSLFPNSYQRMTEKLQNLSIDLYNGKQTLLAQKSSCTYKTHQFLQEFHLPMAISAAFFIGIGLTSYIVAQDSPLLNLQAKIIIPVVCSTIATFTPGMLTLIFNHHASRVDKLAAELMAKQKKLTAHEFRVDCAHAVALFDRAYQDFCSAPSEDKLKTTLAAFKHIPLHGHIYPTAIDPKTYSEAEAQSICHLWLLEQMLKKMRKSMPPASPKDKQSQKEDSLISKLANLFASLAKPPPQTSSIDTCWHTLWKELDIDAPGDKAIDYFRQHKQAPRRKQVAAEIVSLFKGVLNEHYLPMPKLQTPPLFFDY